ncbi:MAG: hypothetical protein ACFFKA_07440 [Candidatus Thorarchaeota archaeon]
MVLQEFRNVFVTLTCLGFLFLSLPAKAQQTQTSTITNGQFKIIKKGEISPFDGVVYDMLGNAIILTDKEQTEKRYNLELKEQKERLEAIHKRDVDNFNLRLDTSQKIFDATINAKDKEIKETREIALNGSNKTILWIVGSFTVGAIVGGAITGIVMLSK